jgi:hypothetical protein
LERLTALPRAREAILYGVGEILLAGARYVIHKITGKYGCLIEVIYTAFIPAVITPAYVRELVQGFEYIGPKKRNIEGQKPGLSVLYWRDDSALRTA